MKLAESHCRLQKLKCTVHPDWNSSNTQFDADIAIMTFRTGEIPSSKFIQPIFLWNDDTPPTQTEGYVAGWGMNQKSDYSWLEETPSKLTVPIHTNAHCWYTEHKLLPISSPRTFCAGKADGTGVCNGDSGGALSFKVGSVF